MSEGGACEESIHPDSGNCFVVAAYDISSTKKRNAVIKVLKSYGFRIQKSVFEAEIPKNRLDRLCASLTPLIDEDTDSIRIYAMTRDCFVWTIGDCGSPAAAVKAKTVII